MTALVTRLRHQLGALGVSALILLAAATAFHVAVLKPLQAESARASERAARLAPGAEPARLSSTADKVATVYRFLQKEEATTDWLAKLHGIGAAAGLQLKSASYRTQDTAGRIVRYEIVLPVTGSYSQIRDFLQRSLAEIPVMSIDQLTLKRESRDDSVVQAELRLTLHRVKP